MRGVLQPRLGILLSNLLFTAMHAYQYNWDGLLSVFASGLALWFPELTLRVLPGSFLNVAQIIHGDEALLAVGSLLTYHVFHMVVLNRWLVPARAEPSQPESLPGPELESQRR